MKKVLLFVTGIISLSLFNGCSKTSVKDGTEAAKVLLANERLDEISLRQEGNLFTSGKRAFKRIQESIDEYSQEITTKGIKYAFNKDGTTYKWSDAPDYSNFLSYFNSYAEGIEYNAEQGSQLIDSTKKNVRIVDKWVDIGHKEILLTVDEDSETIMYRLGNQYEICRRYQNDLGQNVFEMFIENSDTNYRSRMTYIPGLRYEYTSTQNGVMSVIVADKEKGYWDIMDTSFLLYKEESVFVFSNLVMKEEAIYQTSYILDYTSGEKNEFFDAVKLNSADGKSDLLKINNNSVSLYTTGINNLDCFYINANDDEVYDLNKSHHNYPDDPSQFKVYCTGDEDNKSYFTQVNSEVIAKFNNGREMKKGDEFYNGEVYVEGTTIYPIGGVDFYGEINLLFENNNIDSIFTNLKKLSDDFGFTFKGNFDDIKESTKYAIKDSVNFSKYYLWQGKPINDVESIKEVVQLETSLIDEFVRLYDEVKDIEVVKKNQQSKLDSSYKFTNLNVVSKGEFSNSDFEISIKNMSVKVEDISLFVLGEDYQLEFAFALGEEGAYSNLYILGVNNPISKTYNGETDFELTQSSIINVPFLEEGTYTLVAYVATAKEGIRVSEPISVEGSVVETIKDEDGLINKIYSQDNKVKIDSTKTSTINVSLNGNYIYAELYKILESYAYKHGMTLDSDIEKENGSNWEVVAIGDSITNGKYRLKYINNNKDAYVVVVIN